MRPIRTLYKLYEFSGRVSTSFLSTTRDPIFIVGSGRCGTTLLQRILKTHPSINAFPSEGNYLWHPCLFPYRHRTVESPPYFVDPIKFSTISITNWPSNQKSKIYNTLRGFNFLRGHKNSILVNSSMIVFLLPKIIKLFPNSKIIHIYRYGPSVVLSFEKKESQKYIDYYHQNGNLFRKYIAHYWNDNILFFESFKKKLDQPKKRYILDISYEELCDNTNSTLSSISEFLAIDLHKLKINNNIQNMNYKAAESIKDPQWEKLKKIMMPALKIKGY